MSSGTFLINVTARVSVENDFSGDKDDPGVSSMLPFSSRTFAPNQTLRDVVTMLSLLHKLLYALRHGA